LSIRLAKKLNLKTKKQQFYKLRIDLLEEKLYNTNVKRNSLEDTIMKHIETIETRNLCESAKNGGCGECQTSCQSACKTSCGIANQQCENKEEK